jgi:hypothetical protein
VVDNATPQNVRVFYHDKTTGALRVATSSSPGTASSWICDIVDGFGSAHGISGSMGEVSSAPVVNTFNDTEMEVYYIDSTHHTLRSGLLDFSTEVWSTSLIDGATGSKCAGYGVDDSMVPDVSAVSYGTGTGAGIDVFYSDGTTGTIRLAALH